MPLNTTSFFDQTLIYFDHFSTRMIKAILLDLDNTLADFMQFKTQASRAAIHAMVDAGLELDEEEAYNRLFAMYQEVGIEDQKVFNKFIKKIVGKLDYKLLAAGVIAYRQVKSGQLKTYPGVERTLLELKMKGITLGIVSDAPEIQPWLRIEELGLREYFDLVVGFEQTKKLKPSSIPFKKALKILDVKPAQVLFVGDNPSRDIKGAQKVGMKTALAKYGQVFPSKGITADYELEQFSDLLDIVPRNLK